MRRALALLLLLLCTVGCFGVPIHARTSRKPVPEDWRIPHVWVEVPIDEETTLRGIWAERDGPGVVLLYGSNMGLRGIREFIEILYDGGYSVLCCDYRGTGYSSGKWWTSRYLDDDALALLRWVQRETEGPCGVVGVSIGSVAAAMLPYAEDPPAAVILDRPVDPRTVIPRFIGGGMGSIAGFISQFVARPKCDVRMRECLEQAQAPTLLVLPEYDFIFPPEDVEWALSRKSAAVETVTVPGGHLSSHLVEPVTWRKTVLDFLDAHLRPGEPPVAAGRTVPPDPVNVLSYGMDGRRLTVELEEPLPEALEILAMGPRRNVLLTVENPRPRMTFKLPCLRARKMRPLFSVRVVPEGFRPTTGTKRMRIEPE